MARIGLFGKRLPIVGLAILVALPLLGTTLGMTVVPGSATAVDTGLGSNPLGNALPFGGDDGTADSYGTETPAADDVADEPQVIIASDTGGISFQNAPNGTQTTIRDDGASFWASMTIDSSRVGSTMELWIELENSALAEQTARLTLRPESPMEIAGPPTGLPNRVGQDESGGSNVWIFNVPAGVSSVQSVTEESISASGAISYRTDEVVTDRNRDGNITADDFEFVDTDVTDGVTGIETVQVHDDGTATLYLNGSTDDDQTYDRVSYDSGSYLVVSLRIPGGADPGSYTIVGEIETLK